MRLSYVISDLWRNRRFPASWLADGICGANHQALCRAKEESL